MTITRTLEPNEFNKAVALCKNINSPINVQKSREVSRRRFFTIGVTSTSPLERNGADELMDAQLSHFPTYSLTEDSPHSSCPSPDILKNLLEEPKMPVQDQYSLKAQGVFNTRGKEEAMQVVMSSEQDDLFVFIKNRLEEIDWDIQVNYKCLGGGVFDNEEESRRVPAHVKKMLDALTLEELLNASKTADSQSGCYKFFYRTTITNLLDRALAAYTKDNNEQRLRIDLDKVAALFRNKRLKNDERILVINR